MTDSTFPGATPSVSGEHVAWCRFIKEHDRPTRIVLCDSDTDGAFKVYRHSEAKSWRCFHCDFETTDRNEAIGHFGSSRDERVLCLLWEDMTEDQRVTELQACRSERDVFEIEVGNLRRLLGEAKTRGLEWAEQGDALRTERDALVALLEPGKAPAIVRGLYEWAEKYGHGGHMSYSPARTVDDYVDKLTTERDALQAEVDEWKAKAEAGPWVDTRIVQFDDSVVFGLGGFDFDAWDHLREEIHTPQGSFAVWKSGKGRWSMYGGPQGLMALDRYSSEELAKADVIEVIHSMRQVANA